MENEIKEILLSLTNTNYKKKFINKKNIKSILIKKDKVDISLEFNFPITLLLEEFDSIEFMKTLDYDHHLIEECKFHKMWFNISNENDFLFPHNHGDCLLSGVYYVKAPQNCFLHFYDDPKQYKIQMQNPNLFTELVKK